jgi:hypothetical protein
MGDKATDKANQNCSNRRCLSISLWCHFDHHVVHCFQVYLYYLSIQPRSLASLRSPCGSHEVRFDYPSMTCRLHVDLNAVHSEIGLCLLPIDLLGFRISLRSHIGFVSIFFVPLCFRVCSRTSMFSFARTHKHRETFARLASSDLKRHEPGVGFQTIVRLIIINYEGNIRKGSMKRKERAGGIRWRQHEGGIRGASWS